MAGGIERQIFEDAGQPEQATPDTSSPSERTPVDQAVDDAIREMGRGADAPAQPRERAPQSPAPGGPPGLEDVDDKSNAGLLRALLDERDRRQDTARQLERYQTQERERQAREQKPALSERLFSDPDGTLNELRTEWTQPLEQQIAQLMINQDFLAAESRHGDKFRSAWSDWYETVKDGKDAQTYFTVMNSASPGEAMVQWHRRATRDRELGDDDLDAFKQRVIDEYLGNSGAAPPLPRSPNGQFQPRPQAQRIPTSISRMGSSGNPSEDDDGNDGSDAAIFAAARPKHRRQR